MPWASNIAKTMTSTGKQYAREMSTAVARDRKWRDVVAGISARFSKFAFVLFCYITNHLMTGPLGKSEFCFPRFSANKIQCFTRDQSLTVLSINRIPQNTVQLTRKMRTSISQYNSANGHDAHQCVVWRSLVFVLCLYSAIFAVCKEGSSDCYFHSSEYYFSSLDTLYIDKVLQIKTIIRYSFL